MTHQFPNESQQRLDVLDGVWDTTITMLAPDGSDGEISHGTDVYRWIANGFFFVHEVDVEMGGQSVQSIEILGPGSAPGHYTTTSYDPDGTINDFAATLDGHSWRIVGAHQRFAGTFSPDWQSLSGRWEQRDIDSWAPLLKVHLARRAARAPA